MATTIVKSSTASVLASRASAPSTAEAIIIKRGQQRTAPADEGKRAPISRQHCADGAKERRNTVEPDRRLRAGHAKRARGVHHRRLQPVDADRFAVAHVVLIADVDVIAGLDHLLGGLRKIGLVAIDRRNLKDSPARMPEATPASARQRRAGWSATAYSNSADKPLAGQYGRDAQLLVVLMPL